MFAVVFDTDGIDEQLTLEEKSDSITYSDIRFYVLDKFDLKISNSSIDGVKAKCGITSFEKYQRCKKPKLKSEKEKKIYLAFEEMKIVQKIKEQP